MSRIAVVLFNLGGPDSQEAVRPFLFNLFNDPAIMRVPHPVRWLLAQLISRRRAPIAREIYENLGGGSPLLPNTEAQASALKAALAGSGEVEVFISMRYWNPRADETARRVKDFAPDRVVLLPLYPQFSTTTVASSMKDWDRAARQVGLQCETLRICCYPMEPGFIKAEAELLEKALADPKLVIEGKTPRVLFSAHGLPKKIVDAGDPYAWQVEEGAAKVVEAMNNPPQDWLVSYQSRVGPLEWIGPATEDEVIRAGEDGVPLVVVPLAFVSEHSETLVELDIEYAELAEEKGVPAYVRVPTVDDHPAFIGGLAKIVRHALSSGEKGPCCGMGGRLCADGWLGCPAKTNGQTGAAVAHG